MIDVDENTGGLSKHGVTPIIWGLKPTIVGIFCGIYRQPYDMWVSKHGVYSIPQFEGNDHW
jgi:hypothetical protein